MKKSIKNLLTGMLLVPCFMLGACDSGNSNSVAPNTDTQQEMPTNSETNQLTEAKMFEKLQSILRKVEEYDGTLTTIQEVTVEKTDELEQLLAQMAEALNNANLSEEDKAGIQFAISMYNMIGDGDDKSIMAYNKENGTAYQQNYEYSDNVWNLTRAEYFVTNDNEDSTKQHLVYGYRKSMEENEETHEVETKEDFEIKYVSAEYIKNHDLTAEEESKEQQSMMEIDTIMNAESLEDLKAEIHDFTITKVEDGYKAHYILQVEDGEDTNGAKMPEVELLFNDNYVTNIKVTAVIQEALDTQDPQKLTDLFVTYTNITLGYGEFDNDVISEALSLDGFKDLEAHYAGVYIKVLSQNSTDEDFELASINGYYSEKYSEVQVYYNGDYVALGDFIKDHLLYLDSECTDEFVYDANAILPDYDFNLYMIPEENQLDENEAFETLKQVLNNSDYTNNYQNSFTFTSSSYMNKADGVDADVISNLQALSESASDDEKNTILNLLYILQSDENNGNENSFVYDSENNVGYYINRALNGGNWEIINAEFVEKEENEDLTKQYIKFTYHVSKYTEQEDEYIYAKDYVSENYIKNSNGFDFFGGHSNDDRLNDLYKKDIINSAETLDELKEQFPDFEIMQGDGCYIATFSYDTESNEFLRVDAPTTVQITFVFNESDILQSNIYIVVKYALDPNDTEELTDLVEVDLSLNYASDEFDHEILNELVEMDGFNNINDVDYIGVRVLIKNSTDSINDPALAIFDGKYTDTYSDLKGNNNVMFSEYVQNHTLYLDRECTEEFVYDGEEALPDYGFTLYINE